MEYRNPEVVKGLSGFCAIDSAVVGRADAVGKEKRGPDPAARQFGRRGCQTANVEN